MKITISVEGPDAVMQSAIDAYALANGWDTKEAHFDGAGNKTLVPNTQTSLIFAQDCLRDHLLNTIKSYRMRIAHEQATASVESMAAADSSQIALTAITG